MQAILDLQKLAVDANDAIFGTSCSSSFSNCCNPNPN